MTSLAYGDEARDDLDRLVGLLMQDDPAAATLTTVLIVEALEMLARHPLIGGAVDAPYRELVISRGRTGYVALYSYDEERDRVLVHGIGHQREAGFDDQQ